jgi:predicted Zn-ribbon and HTH transcriptional regulator
VKEQTKYHGEELKFRKCSKCGSVTASFVQPSGCLRCKWAERLGNSGYGEKE